MYIIIIIIIHNIIAGLGTIMLNLYHPVFLLKSPT